MRLNKRNWSMFAGFCKKFQGIGLMTSFDNPVANWNRSWYVELKVLYLQFWFTYYFYD